MKQPSVLALSLAVSCLAFAARAADAPKEAGVAAEPAPARSYVGAHSCKPCHDERYEGFQAKASKAKSFTSVEKMKKQLTAAELESCYACHTTGYGKPGGFVSLEQTPTQANAGCEVCHGPGSAHVQSRRKADIQRLPDAKTCETCHSASHVKPIHYRPFLRAGAH